MLNGDIKELLLKDFSKKLKEVRASKKMTQMDLAVESDLSLSFISKLEQGISNISLLQLYSIAAALDIEVIEILPSLPKRNNSSL